MDNKFIKILVSIPVILIALYFIPFLGVMLLIARMFIVPNKKKYISILIIVGVLILLPYGVNEILKLIKITDVPILKDIVNNSLYTGKFIKYSKLLITVGTIFMIISYLVSKLIKKASDSLRNKLSSVIAKEQQTSREIKEKNDLIMREKQEKAKNTHAVTCKHCGNKTLLSSGTGICKYCRNPIEYK